MPKRSPEGTGVLVMAKKYYSHIELKTALVNPQECRFTVTGEEYKPYGTLGSHHVKLSMLDNDDILVEGYSTGGYASGTAIITPKHNLGYDCGNVWRVLDAQYISDPLKKAMVTYKIGNDRIKWVDAGYILPFTLETYCAGEGYQTFVNGECVGWSDSFAVAMHKKIFRLPIDQCHAVGDFYVLKGTPRAKVAQFITKVMSGPTIPPPGSAITPYPFESGYLQYRENLIQ